MLESKTRRLQMAAVALTVSVLVAFPGAAFGLGSRSSAPVQTSRPSLATLKSLISSAASASSAPASSTDVPSLSNLDQWWTSPNKSSIGYNHTECANNGASQPSVSWTDCVYGDLAATRTIMEFGDADDQMWIPALDSFGLDHHWKIIAFTQAACQPWATPWLPSSLVLYKQITVGICNSWRGNVLSLIKTNKPTYVLPIGVGPHDHRTPYPTLPVLESSITTLITQVKSYGSKPILFQPMPRYDVTQPITITPYQCLTVHPSNIKPCEITPAMQTNLMAAAAFKVVAKNSKTTEVGTQSLFCTASLCPLFVKTGSVTHLIYENGDHMTFTYSQWISSALGELLSGILPN